MTQAAKNDGDVARKAVCGDLKRIVTMLANPREDAVFVTQQAKNFFTLAARLPGAFAWPDTEEPEAYAAYAQDAAYAAVAMRVALNFFSEVVPYATLLLIQERFAAAEKYQKVLTERAHSAQVVATSLSWLNGPGPSA